MSKETRYIAGLMKNRARRMQIGFTKIGVLLGLVQLLTMHKYSFADYYQGFGTMLFFALAGRLYSIRSRSVALRGKFMFTRLECHEYILGTDALPPSQATVPFNVVSNLWTMVISWFGNLLPIRIKPFYIEINGKQRYADLFLFNDEEPVVTEEDEILCMVATDLWFYPPSPWVVRARQGDQDLEKIREVVHSVIKRLKDEKEFKELRDSSEIDEARRAFKRMCISIPLAIAGIWILYLPFGMSWLVFSILGVLTLAPILLGFFRRKYG